MARELAFTTDPHLLDILSRITVLLVPSINADGRAANTRGNSTGQDLNRDYADASLNAREFFSFARVRDSIWRTRSRVTPTSEPIASSVIGSPEDRP